MARVVLGVTGGIAVYKAIDAARRLREQGHEVRVVPTAASLNFVGAATWQAISGQPVQTEVFSETDQVAHVRLGQSADLVLVAPATADLLARAATGRADDLLTNVLLTARGTVAMVPAMHTEMWQHPATCANVATLRDRGVVVMDPASGRLTGADSGPGRLPEPAEIVSLATCLLECPDHAVAASTQDLAGQRIVISAGGTHEPLDPVRYLGNASSGRMGIALAAAARLRGATVTIVGANLSLPTPADCALVRVGNARELAAAMTDHGREADVVVMCAAVADYRPRHDLPTKHKKSEGDGWTLELVQNPDILAGLVAARRPGQTIVGFAAETARGAELTELATAKLRHKGCDLLVANDVSAGAVFGADHTSVQILRREGDAVTVAAEATGGKDAVAHRVLDAVHDQRLVQRDGISKDGPSFR